MAYAGYSVSGSDRIRWVIISLGRARTFIAGACRSERAEILRL
jgi:hypothetical protein